VKPRRDRWLSLMEVAELIGRHNKRVLALSRKRRREHVLRLVRRVERINEQRIAKRVGREWFVSRNYVDALQQWEPEALSELEQNVASIKQKQEAQQRQINGHGSRLRIVEKRQHAAETFLSTIAKLDAADEPQDRRTG
jgi:nuclear transport factor 2 (NTF2) superfamily protein